MPAPQSKVDICNLALDKIGQSLVSDIDTPADQDSATLARWYDTTRQNLLRKYVWNFAKTRTVLSRSEIAPAFEYADQYPLPTDFLRLLSIGEYEYDGMTEYDITGDETDGRVIQCNNSNSNALYIRYIRDVENIALFDPLFISVLHLQLALNISYKFNLKISTVKKINEELTLELSKAVSVDGQERPTRRIQNSKFLRARRNLGMGTTATPWTYFN